MKNLLVVLLIAIVIVGGLKLGGVRLPVIDYAVGPIGGSDARGPAMPDVEIEAPGFGEFTAPVEHYLSVQDKFRRGNRLVILAYIDPGAGSMLIQAILAGVLAIPFFFRSAVTGAVARFRSNRRAARPATSPSPDDRSH